MRRLSAAKRTSCKKVREIYVQTQYLMKLDYRMTYCVLCCGVFLICFPAYACVYIHLCSPTMVAENKNLHITHIKRKLTKHRLYIKVSRIFY